MKRSRNTPQRDDRGTSPLALHLARVAVCAGVVDEVIALLRDPESDLLNPANPDDTLPASATSVARGNQGEATPWVQREKTRKDREYEDPTSIEEDDMSAGEWSSLMKEVVQRLSATEQRSKQKNE